MNKATSASPSQYIVAVLGCGVIGLSWVRAFLDKGHVVRAWDPDKNLESKLESLKTELPGAVMSFHPTPEAAVVGAHFVQESGPEMLSVKQALYARIAPVMREDAILASSTSTLLPSQLQEGTVFAERIVIGHPFNPPHLLPLVEVVGGNSTSEKTIERAMAFYRALGKKPIHLRTERPGHLANRLQAALWREAVDAVASGQASVEDVDLAVTAALGPRWAVMGPFKTFHLGGGEGGLARFLAHLGDAFEALWDDAHRPEMTASLKQKLIAETKQEVKGCSPQELAAERDSKLRALFVSR